MADTTNTAEIQVVVDASGVEAGLRQATTAAERTERQITTGASNSARSQGSLVAAIQRTTAQMESGGRAGSRYFEILAQQRGVNPQALEPYLRQLRAVEQAQQRAGQSAAQTSNAMRQLPAQLTDVLTSLQGGQSPLTVLLQQGGQVTDSFGGMGAAIRAVGAQVLGLLNPVTLTVAAVAGLGYAFYSGSQEARAYNLAIATTGNAAGTSAALMAEAAAQTAEFIGSQSNAASVLASMVATGQISSAAMVDLSVAAIKAQRDLGREVSTTVDEFAALGKDPVKALADLIGKYHHLTGATYAQVKALQDEGRTVEAVTLAQKAHADGINSQSSRVVENLGYIESAWRGVSKGVSEAAGSVKDWFLSIGRADTLAELTASAAKIQKNIDLANARKDTWGAAKQQGLLDVLNGEIAAMQKKLGLSQQEADADARKARAEQLRVEIASGMDKLLSREELRTRALAAARVKAAENGLSEVETRNLLAITAKEYADVEEAAQKKREAAAKKAAEALKKEAGLMAELAGLTPGFAEDWDRLSKAYAKGALSLDQLTQRQAELLAKQPGIKKANDDQIKALAESDKLYDQGIKTAEQYRDSLLEQLGAQRQSNEQIGLTGPALAELTALRLESTAAQKEESAAAIEAIDPGSQLAKSYREQAEALRDLAAAKRDGAVKQASADSAKQFEEDWKRSAEQIGQSLTDNLMRGGKNAADYLKDLFRTLVLRPILQPIGNAVGNFVNGAMGMPGGASGSGSSPGVAESVARIYDAFKSGGGMEQSIAQGVQRGFDAAGVSPSGGAPGTAAQWAGRAGGTIAGYMAGDALNRGISGGYETGSGFMKSQQVQTAIASAVFGPIGGAVAGAIGGLINRAFGMKDKEYGQTTLNGTFGAGGFSGTRDTPWTQKGGWFRSDKSDIDKVGVDADAAKQFTAAYDAIKAASADFASVLGINADAIKDRAQSMSIALGKDEEANKKAIADFFVNVGNTIAGELLPSLSAFQKEGEAASGTLERLATGYALVDTALTSVGMSFGAVGTASLEARERLLAAAGGLEAFAANTAGFQQNFLTEAERNAPVLKSVTEELAALGLSAVDTRDEFKAVVLGLDLTTEAGAKQYGALMKLQAAFAQVYPTTEAVTAALAEQEEAARRAAEASLQAAAAQAQAAEEARQAAIQSRKDFAGNLLSGVDSAFSALQSVVGREKALLQESAGAHRALSDALRGTLDSMSVSGRELEDRLGAQAQIRTALAIAKASGVLPDADKLRGALSVLGKDSSALFATQQDYLRDFYSTQNDIAALAGLTDDALSVEEKSLKALDGILESAQQQINVLKGVDYSVFSLAEAIRGWNGALGAAKADPVASAGGSIAKLYQELLGRPADSAGLDYWKNAVAGGLSLDEVRKMIMQGSEYQLRGFAVGTNYVPTNMPAMIHEGERIIPAADNRELMRRLSSPSDNSAVLAAAVERLTATVARQQVALDKIEESTRRNADMIEQATGGGGPLQVEFAE